ncbi:glutathione synthase [Zychaea mexicana]|uniref:glutathione synthase n=1 Tax=Zychaea mexicana TaxID=64656 RepID=UPI0022FEFAB8|nr:glutathione synthase [Zychaea mexicana]KAI9492816.1 glutathione synthase [Zychaea mexicana]
MTYPPSQSDADREALLTDAIDWAQAHGLLVRPSQDKVADFANHSLVTHAPFTLYPTPFPRAEFEKAKGLQQPWNTLIHKLSEDDALISEVMESLSEVDDFMQKLYDIYLKVKEEGVAQKASLGIHRCDYLLHAEPGADAKTARIQQVEFNTIASSFGSLSTWTSKLHRYLLQASERYAGGLINIDQLPENRSIQAIAGGIASAWKLYGNPNARVMMVVQPGERNAFDQRWIEYELLESHGIRLLRRTLEEIEDSGKLDAKSKTLTIEGHEIAVAYFRSGYAPTDFPSHKEWAARLKVERSLSIKCPTVAYQIVGAKKVQQLLSVPGRLERYVDVYTAELLRESFTGLYPFDSSPQGQQAYKLALQSPERFVMKPQREGGGNNIYGDDIVEALNKLSNEERTAFILMELIRSPPLENLMVREGKLIEGEVASELGIYGIYLNDGDKASVNEIGGHLLRTKAHATKEGGVAAGFAVIDSPLLV